MHRGTENRWTTPAAAVVGVVALALALHTLGADRPPNAGINLDQRLRDVRINHDADGFSITPVDEAGRAMAPLSAAEFSASLDQRQNELRSHGRLFHVLNITTPFGLVWVAVGLLGQALFTGRMIVQWIVSEKEKRSTIPVAFWWMSLAGSSMLVIYFIWRKDVVGVLGQSTGWFVYLRNLLLIHRAKPAPASRATGLEARPAPQAA